ncbi:MAG: ROK family protein [Chloroflexi bacterium]|nr:ROK family protein [Chloroflexota bacterium]
MFTPAPALTGRSIGNIKTHNLRAVLLTLLHGGPTSRVRMAQLTGLSSTTITNLVAELLEQGIVAETGKEGAAEGRNGNGRPGVGRPATLVSIIPAARYAVGVHIGVDTLRVGVTDLFGELRAYRVFAHSTDTPAADLLDAAARLAEEVTTAAGLTREQLLGVGVGASGLVDLETGVNVLAPNLGWRSVPIRDILSRRLSLPVFVDNNVRAMALAEAMFGAGRGVNTLAFVYGRVGVGAGFTVGGQIYRGSRAGAGEIGHTTMIPAGGAPCRCGNTGCLETLVSEQEIIRQAQVLAARAPDSILAAKLTKDEGRKTEDGTSAAFVVGRSSPVVRQAFDDVPDTPIERIFAAARAGDRDTLAMLDERAFYIGTALANLVNLINPETIILGGLFAAGADLMLPRIEETLRRRSFAGLGDVVALRVTTFGRKVGVIGAAALALDAFFYRQTPANELAG